MKIRKWAAEAFLFFASTLIIAGSLPVGAAQALTAAESYSYNASDVYLADETEMLTDSAGNAITAKLINTSSAIDFKIALYIGGKNRGREAVEKLVSQGVNSVFSLEKEKSIFLYLDMDGSSDVCDYMYCGAEALLYYSNGENGTENRINTILNQMRLSMEQTSDQSVDAKTTAAVESFCSGLKQYKDALELDGEALEYKGESVYFYDEGALFTKEQRQQIISRMMETSRTVEFNLAIYSGSQKRSDSEIKRIARDGAKSTFSFRKYNGTVYLYIDMDGLKNAFDYMFAANDAFLYYTNGDSGSDDRIDHILEAMERSFPAGGQKIVPEKIVEGLEEYCRQLIHYKQEGAVSGIYYRDEATGDYVYYQNGQIVHSKWKPYRFWYAGLGGGVIVGLFVAMVIGAAIKKHYKFKISEPASVYTSKEKMLMRASDDIFIGKHVSKVRIQSSSSGGHGGGGGGFHSGGGGGGRHR